MIGRSNICKKDAWNGRMQKEMGSREKKLKRQDKELPEELPVTALHQ